MSDVFISYKKEDGERARQIAAALEREGISVWWDREIPPGKTWAQVIESAINDCRCVLVLWTEKSVASDWVHKEARKGEHRRILIPALLDAVNPPFEFEHVQAANLTAWSGNGNDPHFQQLVQQVKQVVGPRHSRTSLKMIAIAAEEAIRRRFATRRTIVVASGILSTALGAYLLLARSGSARFDLRDVRLTGMTATLGAANIEAIPVTELLVSGVREIDLSADADRPPLSDATADAVLVSVIENPDAGSIDIGSLSIPEGARLSIATRDGEVRLSVAGLTQEILIAVAGTVTVLVPDVVDEVRSFGPGTALRMLPDPAGVDLDFRIETATVSLLLLESVPVHEIELYRVDQDVDLTATTARAVSTVLAGELTSPSARRVLNVGEGIRFDTFEGQITQMLVGRDTVMLTATGTNVTGARVGVAEPRANLMPRIVASRGALFRNFMVAVMVLFYPALGFFALRAWRRT